MVNRRFVNPMNIRQGNGSCIFMTFSLIIECFTKQSVYKTIKEFLRNTKGIDVGNCPFPEVEKTLIDEAYFINPIQTGDVSINHDFFKTYFDNHLKNSMKMLTASVLNVIQDKAIIEKTLQDTTSLISLALHQLNSRKEQETHIVVVGFESEFYVVDTRPNQHPNHVNGKYSLGDTILNFNEIGFPGFVDHNSSFTYGDSLLITILEIPNQ